MDKTKFKRLLFDIACCTMACDYDIDEREIRELKYIEKTTSYFKGIDLSDRLDRFLESIKDNSEDIIQEQLQKLNEYTLNPVQEMLILEISLRIVYADAKIDPHEVEFVQKIRSYLSLGDEIVKDRFGQIDFLFHSDEKISLTKKRSKDSNKSIDITNFENMYADLGGKKESK